MYEVVREFVEEPIKLYQNLPRVPLSHYTL